MNILLTGASSFTGCWFAQALVDGGHHVVAPLRSGTASGADKERAERLHRLAGKAELIPNCPFGSPGFLDLAKSRAWDVLCHHGAEVGDYRNPDFDIAGALARNTLNLRALLAVLAGRGLKGVVITGSFFEHNEGAGTEPRVAFSPYGVSKGLTADVVRHHCHEIAMPLGKFVIPHPFGPLEQPRLGAYLARTWQAGETAQIKTPAYVRDNIPVSLLALAYRRFVEQAPGAPLWRRLNPSGYVETQGAFVERLAREFGRRTGLACRVELQRQLEFPEPAVRINTDRAVAYVGDWDEGRAWDDYTQFYVAS